MFYFQLLVQVNITAMPCEGPEFLIYHKLFNEEMDFAQCVLMEQRKHIKSSGKILRECNFRCGNFLGSTEIPLMLQLQRTPWSPDLDYLYYQISGVSIQEQTI